MLRVFGTLGRGGLKTPMFYSPVVNRGPPGVCRPVDGL